MVRQKRIWKASGKRGNKVLKQRRASTQLEILLAVFALVFLASCGDGAPPHYYVLCDGKDGNGWNLINAERNENGYILACTYQSPDRQNAYTVRCTKNGCD